MALFGSGQEQALSIVIKARDEASKVLRQVEGQADKTARGFKASGALIAAAAAATATAVAGLGLSAVKTAGDFEASMNRVQAVLMPTGDEFEALARRARDLGKSTVFSAQEAANAIETLAKNGLNATQILDGAVDASLHLAAATGTDMANAADIATDVMLQFNKEAKDLAQLVNDIAGVTVKSKFSIDDYRLALAQAGGVAGGLGVSFEDFNTAIAATSSLFASGSDAGTSFKVFLQRLSPVSDKAAAEIEKLGFDFFDANGKMHDMSVISEELAEGLKDLTEEQRAQSLSTIFGTDAMRTAIGLSKVAGENFNALGEEIKKISAEEMAQARMKGLAGAMEELKGAWEEFQLTLADTGVLELATKAIIGITEIMRQLAEGVGWVKGQFEEGGGAFARFAQTIDEKSGLITLFKWAWDQIVTTFREHLLPAFQRLIEALEPWAPMLKALGFIVGVTLVGVIYAITLAITGWIEIISLFIGKAADFASAVLEKLKAPVEGFIDAVKNAIEWLGKLLSKMSNFGSGLGKRVGNLLGFEHGGIVPGPVGRPVSIVAHGGERIVPQSATRGGGSTANISVTINNPVVRSSQDLDVMKRQIDQALRGLIRDHKLSTI